MKKKKNAELEDLSRLADLVDHDDYMREFINGIRKKGNKKDLTEFERQSLIVAMNNIDLVADTLEDRQLILEEIIKVCNKRRDVYHDPHMVYTLLTAEFLIRHI